MKPAHRLTVDVLIPAAAWRRALPSAGTVCRKAARAAFTGAASAALKRKAGRAELAVVLASDATVRRLNATFRKQDKPTNVLSFPAGAARALGGGAETILGDVVIAYETVAAEARKSSKPLKSYLSHLVVHGVLHLLGYDHGAAAEAEAMERLEAAILSQIGITDPYRDAASATPARRPRGARRRS